MKRVLVLAYHFPPLGGAGVQRNVKFVRYLADHGWQPVVVTGAGTRDAPWAPPDDSLLEEIPEHVPIVRIDGHEPGLRRGYGAAAERALGLTPPRTRFWIDGAVAVGREQPDIDVIYASLIPYETAEAAAHLSAATGRPWIADLQDPWALDEMWLYPTALHRRRDLRRMRTLLSTASSIIMNTPEAGLRLQRHFPELEATTVVIPNGFDPDDFPAEHPARDPEAPFKIVHSGYLYTEPGLRIRRTAALRRRLGGFLMPIDLLPRSHAYLVEGLDRLLARRPDLEGRFELHLAGTLSGSDRRISGQRSYVRAHGYVPHGEVVRLLAGADLLFLPMHDIPEGERAGIVPGKTYEYLGSGRPILAAVPEGDAADLLRDVPQAVVCGPTDIDALSEAVERAIASNGSRELSAGDEASELVSQFDRRHLTERLAGVFTDVDGRGVNPMGRATPIGLKSRLRRSLSSAETRTTRVVSEEGFLALGRRATVHTVRPAVTPAVAAVLRRRAARSGTIAKKIDMVYDFDVLGIKLAPWQHRDELHQLLSILSARSPRTVIEIGTGNGGTLFLLSEVAHPDALIISVDLPAGEFGGGYPLWRVPLYRSFASRGQRINLFRKDSHEQETLEEVRRALGGRLVDFLFIDGDHSYQGVSRDFEMYSTLLAPTGLVAFHDVVPGLAIPDRFRDRDRKDLSCVGDVPRFWQDLGTQIPTTELVADWSQGRFGIGLVEAKDLASLDHHLARSEAAG